RPATPCRVWVRSGWPWSLGGFAVDRSRFFRIWFPPICLSFAATPLRWVWAVVVVQAALIALLFYQALSDAALYIGTEGIARLCRYIGLRPLPHAAWAQTLGTIRCRRAGPFCSAQSPPNGS